MFELCASEVASGGYQTAHGLIGNSNKSSILQFLILSSDTLKIDVDCAGQSKAKRFF